LFVKSGCGWCDEAVDWLVAHGFEYEQLNVTVNASARREMLELSGQTLAPVIEVDGQILADFGTDELEVWWREEGFPPRGGAG
jgi:monothiol glutaredoxin